VMGARRQSIVETTSIKSLTAQNGSLRGESRTRP
jgi:hypothetical protein